MTQPKTQLFNRERELSIIGDRVDILRGGGGVFQCVINFYGIPGIGKTALLRELFRRAQTGRWDGRPSEPFPVALSDLASNTSFADQWRGGAAVLAELTRQLEEQSQQKESSFFKEFEAFQALPKPDPHDEEAYHLFRWQAKRVADVFTIYVDRLIQRQPVMLLFDNTEKIPMEVFDWLEVEVLSPLVQSDRILLVVAGCSPVRWKRFEVRRRVLLHKLDPPRPPEEFLERQSPRFSQLASDIARITFGYPWGNEVVLNELIKLQKTQTIDRSNFDQFRPLLLNRLVEEVIENKVMAEVDPDLRCAFHTIAPLRQFDVSTLQAILPRFAPTMFAGKGGNYFLLMLNRMVDTMLVEWSAKRKGYVLDDTLRRILALDMEVRQPDQFMAINQRAIELYESWLEEAPQIHGGYIIDGYIVEWLYHRARAMQHEGMSLDAIGRRLQEDLQKCLDRFYQPTEADISRVIDGARRLSEELQRDDELEELLGKEVKQPLLRVIDVHISRLRQHLLASRKV